MHTERQYNKTRGYEMSNEIALKDIHSMAKTIVASHMFGVDNEHQAVALMLLSQAQGYTP